MSEQNREQMKDYREYLWWCSSNFPQIDLKIIEIDSRVLVAFVPFFFHFSDPTFWFAMFVLGLFVLFGYLGYPVVVALKKGKKFFTGSVRSVRTNKRSRRSFLHG